MLRSARNDISEEEEPLPSLSLRGARQGDVAMTSWKRRAAGCSAEETRRLLRFARNDISWREEIALLRSR